ncbi:MAG: P1 family peptidase [Aggregatilineales bacterium]
MKRIRDFGLQPGILPAGMYNAITDVPGVKVGQVTLNQGDDVRTGVTAILPHDGNLFADKVPAAVYTINGFGKACGFEQVREMGHIETPVLLTNTLNVPRVADALMTYMLRRNPRIGRDSTGTVNPLVGECNDGFINDIRARYVTEAHVLQALEDATGGKVAEGNVGAGTGTVCYGFKGGMGTASRQIVTDDETYHLGVLLQTNFGRREELVISGIPVGQHYKDKHLPRPGIPDGSIMVVIATDAPFTSRQLQRLCKRVSFGLGRTGTVGHHGSGDFVIAFSTANRYAHASQLTYDSILRLVETCLIDTFFTAVVESVQEAVYNALVAAETMTGRDGNTLYALPHDALVSASAH